MCSSCDTLIRTQVREPPSGFINPASVRETREVTMVSLSYFLSSLCRGKQTWMMSFLNPLRPFPQSFFFSQLLEKQVHAVLDVSGRKALLKERWRGSIWGQKTNKRPLLLWFWFYVIPQLAPRRQAWSVALGQTKEIRLLPHYHS